MRPSGSVTAVGIGPGSPEHITPAARQALESADVIIGYHAYLHFIADIAPHVRRIGSGMRQEVERVRYAIQLAQHGNRVALVSGGDAGIYGMAGLLLEMLHAQRLSEIPVHIIPGISALNAAAALLGAPLMTDFAVISLSDYLVARETILHRVEAAAQADLVLCLYNPKSSRRREVFDQVCELLRHYRAPETPVGVVRAAYRPDQQVTLTTLERLSDVPVDMHTLVIVGNRSTYVHDNRMVTPRGYAEHRNLNESRME
ncbi:MAG: precorrin-3B C(17)-methyltransferase [Ardenticatenia bacterium]|jgi:precorrin-3B C17-methyltransferase|nr:MAG: precorrin-3B C(17)-methyltransferase [Ardenticatenia bacterium]